MRLAPILCSGRASTFGAPFRKACTGKLGRPAEAPTILDSPADGSPKTLTSDESIDRRQAPRPQDSLCQLAGPVRRLLPSSAALARCCLQRVVGVHIPWLTNYLTRRSSASPDAVPLFSIWKTYSERSATNRSSCVLRSRPVRSEIRPSRCAIVFLCTPLLRRCFVNSSRQSRRAASQEESRCFGSSFSNSPRFSSRNRRMPTSWRRLATCRYACTVVHDRGGLAHLP